MGCCPESISDLSNWFKLNWHGALPDASMLLYISEPFWAVNVFRVKAECTRKWTQRSNPGGQPGSLGGHVKTGYECAEAITAAPFGLLSAISTSCWWQSCTQALVRRPWNGPSRCLWLHVFIYCNIYKHCLGKLLHPAAAAWTEGRLGISLIPAFLWMAWWPWPSHLTSTLWGLFL